MYIKKIELKNFRNYGQQEVELEKNINIFYGQNAQGKTNIIESIYISSTGKSHRTQKDAELIKWNSEEARISILFNDEEKDNNIDIFFSNTIKKRIKINGVKIQKTGDLLGNLNTVIFSPDHMKIIKDGPVERRRFIDIILSQINTSYYYNLVQYLKVVEQRNVLLHSAKTNRNVLKTIDIWDEQLIEYGEKIIRERKKFIDYISKYSNHVAKEITNNKENIEVLYKSSIEAENYTSENIKKAFKLSLQKSREIDYIRGMTNKGPHRDDFSVLVNGRDVKIYGSQGQQRTALLALKISELQYMVDETSAYPVLLLDDVFSELDKERQKFLLNYVKKIQTIITCTDVEYFKDFDCENCKFYHVSQGNIE